MNLSVLKNLFRSVVAENGNITCIVGTGISEDSYTSTYLERELNREEFQSEPHDIQTLRHFLNSPEEVWKWYLYQRTLYRNSVPNQGHVAVKRLGDILGDSFRLISQNVDGLHRRAGQDMNNTFLIHGDLNFTRCFNHCTDELFPFPDHLGNKPRNFSWQNGELEELKCPKCGSWLRPHVLWKDEYYNEKYYKMHSVLNLSYDTDLLLVVGDAGTTHLPARIIDNVMYLGHKMVDINRVDTLYSQKALNYANGYAYSGHCSDILSELVYTLEGEMAVA